MEMIDIYKQLKKDNPLAYTAVAMMPVSGQAVAVADYAEAIRDNDTEGAALAAASLIPGVRMAKYGSKLAPASFRLKSQMSTTERVIAPAVRQADKIGKAMGAEQAGEYVEGKLNSTPTSESQQRDRDQYQQAWEQLN